MKNKILIEGRRNYGAMHYYVVSDHAAAIRSLTGAKTVSAADVQALTLLGFVVEIAPAKVVSALEAMA